MWNCENSENVEPVVENVEPDVEEDDDDRFQYFFQYHH